MTYSEFEKKCLHIKRHHPLSSLQCIKCSLDEKEMGKEVPNNFFKYYKYTMPKVAIISTSRNV